MIKISEIRVLDHYKIKLLFSDGFEKIVDFRPFIGNDEITSPLSEPTYFSKVKIYENGRGIFWPNEFDVCPDYLRYYLT